MYSGVGVLQNLQILEEMPSLSMWLTEIESTSNLEARTYPMARSVSNKATKAVAAAAARLSVRHTRR
jgi:hypothetical protein